MDFFWIFSGKETYFRLLEKRMVKCATCGRAFTLRELILGTPHGGWNCIDHGKFVSHNILQASNVVSGVSRVTGVFPGPHGGEPFDKGSEHIAGDYSSLSSSSQALSSLSSPPSPPSPPSFSFPMADSLNQVASDTSAGPASYIASAKAMHRRFKVWSGKHGADGHNLSLYGELTFGSVDRIFDAMEEHMG